ncbi:MAG TPA: hypothetical protein VIP77_05095 [Jiangellaceae bacterium]
MSAIEQIKVSCDRARGHLELVRDSMATCVILAGDVRGHTLGHIGLTGLGDPLSNLELTFQELRETARSLVSRAADVSTILDTAVKLADTKTDALAHLTANNADLLQLVAALGQIEIDLGDQLRAITTTLAADDAVTPRLHGAVTSAMNTVSEAKGAVVDAVHGHDDGIDQVGGAG